MTLHKKVLLWGLWSDCGQIRLFKETSQGWVGLILPFDQILDQIYEKNTIKAGGSTAICKMLTGVGDGVDGVDPP